MKIYKRIIVGFVVAITILGLLAFYFPVRNIPQQQTSSSAEPEKNYSASLNQASTTSTSTITSTSTTILTPTSTPEKASFDDMSGFSDLSQENDLIEGMGVDSSSSNIDDIYKDLNQ